MIIQPVFSKYQGHRKQTNGFWVSLKAGDIDPVTVKIANWLLIRQPEL